MTIDAKAALARLRNGQGCQCDPRYAKCYYCRDIEALRPLTSSEHDHRSSVEAGSLNRL